MRSSHRAQSAVEVAVLMAALVASLIVMQRYVKGALQQRWRQAGDTFGYGQQYAPGVTAIK